MAFPFDFIGEDQMTELSNAANKAFLIQRTDGFGSSQPDMTKAVNGDTAMSNTGGAVFGRQPLIASVGVAIGGTVIDLDLLKGGADMPRPAQGSFTVQGDIVVNATARNGMELLHRNITQDQNPTVSYADGGASFPSEHTLVASAAFAGASDVDVVHAVVPVPATIEYEFEPQITLSGTPAVKANALEAIVKITGEDRNGIEMERVLRYTPANIAVGTRGIGDFFKTVTRVETIGFTAATMGEVKAIDKATKIVYTPYDQAIVDYMDLELDIGNLVPFSFFGGAVNGVGFNFTRDEVVQYTMGCLFGRVGIRENLTGGDDPSVLPAGIRNANPSVFVGTQCEVEVAGVVLPLDGAALNMSQSYVASPYIGKTIWPKKPRRSGYRSLSLSLNFPATLENNWLQYFQAHADLERVIVRAKNGVIGTQGQFGGIVEWSFDRVILSEAPGIATVGQDVAAQTATLMPYSDTENAAFEISSIQSDYEEKLYRYA